MDAKTNPKQYWTDRVNEATASGSADARAELVEEILAHLIDTYPFFDMCLEYMCTRYEVTEEEIKGPGRVRKFAHIRFELVWLVRAGQAQNEVRQLYPNEMTYEALGMHLGGRDHSTMVHAISWVRNKMRRSTQYAKKMDGMLAEVIDLAAQANKDDKLNKKVA